ncbi:MAG: hypothetical protein US14_C0018G0004 [candidate division WS6 bacterium GW2011_WS6_36_26]|uniref:N-formylglutamate amidohydrolase n=1 Tax=candidate division WS6 bacterium GW2011_GWF1_36_8 TaxID=1619098 RepID=A0A0G0HX02_9BACT|nr:MAG: hypothetical protein US14_C0018G0004 [candidate division WS6 bacterium GW2011_WS6_36_26]KKQ16589.1 MAG: hypothetical protein US29_C0021G0005 [candidate division WS6 bacterium GW2011_GWF1_36_8]HAM96191.1 hypothetical protein [Patescibacteria group bacterium]
METAQFQIIEGKVPVLISAPHARSHRRPTLLGKYKLGEPYTETIVKEVSQRVGSFGIYLSDECNYDPNYHKERKNEYKQAVKEIITKNKVERFIDIHGLRDNQSYDIALYYPTKFRKSLELAYEIEDALNHGLLNGISIRIFRFLDNGQETLGEYVAAKLRIPSVQIEVSRYIRDDDRLREAFISNFSTLVGKYI